MADVLKLFSELPSETDPTSTGILAIEDGSTGTYYHVTIADLFKNINLVAFTETEYDNGSISSGTFTPDCDANGNSHRVTLTGTATIEVPTKTLSGSEMIEAGITIIGGDTYPPSWGVNWDWGTAGAPTLTAKSMVGFKRRAGDTKTMAWHHGGFG